MEKEIRVLFFIFLGAIFLLPSMIVKAETYDGEYSVDYLLRNYGVVTLGQKDTNMYGKIQGAYGYNLESDSSGQSVKKGDFQNYTNVTGAILINGDYKSINNSVFGTEAGNVKSFIKGNKDSNVTTTSQLATDPNYVDFKKMYNQVMIDSKELAENTDYYINNSKVEISKPGIYTINNMATHCDDNASHSSYYGNFILIKNYDANNIYVFNYYNEYFEHIPSIMIMESGSNNAVSLVEYIKNRQYTGNIIFNFPNAKYIINKGWMVAGTIIAPNATFGYSPNYEGHYESSDGIYYHDRNIYGSLIVNTLYNASNTQNSSYSRFNNNIKSTVYKLNKRIVDQKNNYYEEVDYDDDEYSRDYSISDLLQNYNLVTLGHKQIDTKSKILQFGNTPGSIKLFHLTGQVLIAGDLYGKKYNNVDDDFYSSSTTYYDTRCSKIDRIAFDLESNKVTESFIKGNTTINTDCTTIRKYNNTVENYNTLLPITVIQPWDNMAYDNYFFRDRKNSLITKTSNYSYDRSGEGNMSFYMDNYINFDRLYNNIVSEQKGIDEGTKVNSSNGVAHIEIGGNYVINNINDINKIVFDNFDDNKKMITVITIKNSGDINFPEINRDNGAYKGIVTNDYFGKERATHFYEQNTFINEDSYYGNIVWNVPNATYIKLKENVPFAGHLIAPNADVETAETHFAGCFIVNSFYGEGNTEAHFYPLTAYDNCECDDSKVPNNLKLRFNEMRLDKLLGGEKTTIEKTVLGDQVQYNKDTELLNNIINTCPKKNNSQIVQILTNPKTYSTIGIVLGIVLIAFIGFKLITKKQKTIN